MDFDMIAKRIDTFDIEFFKELDNKMAGHLKRFDTIQVCQC